LGEHFELRLDQVGPVQAAEHDEDEAGKALQVAGEQAGAALRAEVAIESLAGRGGVVTALRVATEEREVRLRHTEERRHFAARRFLAVEAVANGDKIGVLVELERHGTTGAPARVLLGHGLSPSVGHGFRAPRGCGRGPAASRQDAAFFLRASRSVRAVCFDDPGFCPVISRPSWTTCTPQSAVFENLAPCAFSTSSSRYGTTSTSCTAASSEFVKPVTERPFAIGAPSGAFTFVRIPGAWQTSATGFSAASMPSMRDSALRSFVRSQSGPWPPGKNT